VDLPGASSCTLAHLTELLSASFAPAVRINPRHANAPNTNAPNTDIGVVRRRTPDADVYLVINTGPFLREFALSVDSARSWYEEWDAGSGQVVRTGQPVGGVDLSLHPYQATVIVLSDRQHALSDAGVDDAHGQLRRVLLDDGWRVQFGNNDAGVDVTLPHVWESDPEHLAFSGSATYKCRVDVPELGSSPRVVLDFGVALPTVLGATEPDAIRGHAYRAEIDPPVGVIAEVRVNDMDCGMVWAPPYTIDVSSAVIPGPNRVEIVVHNTLANALASEEQLSSLVADSERRYGRRFRMQELDRAMEGVRSGLLAVPTLLISG
jgi:hypothetical protein